MATDFNVLNVQPELIRSPVLPTSLPVRTLALKSNRGSLTRDHWRADKLAVLDQSRLIVDRLFLSPGAPRSVVFSGLDCASGCTQIVYAAAEMLAVSTEMTVCVVDANPYSPTLGSLYDLSGTGGLSDALLEERSVLEYVQRLENGNLFVLPYGSRTAIDIQKRGGCFWTRDSINVLRTNFNFILVDTPCVSRYSDAVTLGAAVGGVALIVRAGTTRRDMAAKAVSFLKTMNVRMLGAIVTPPKSVTRQS